MSAASAATGAERNPSAERNPYVDLLRVGSICAVVLGHWLATGITYQHGRFHGVDMLGVVHWGGWVTLALQVVPVFFLVGGYANATSWTRHRAAGWQPWVRLRMLRLLVPTSLYAVVIALLAVVCELAGVPRAELSQAAWAVALHLWFLAAYAVLLLVTPLLYAAHRRFGAWVPVLMGALAVVIDVAVINEHVHFIGWTNYLLVWGTFHQVGFGWQDARVGRREAAGLAAAAVVGLALLIGPGPYAVSMVGAPGSRIENASPPSAALLAFGLAQAGVVVLAEPWVRRFLGTARRRRAITRADALVMPMYLWHMAPVVVVAIVGYPSGLFSQPRLGSSAWWWQRVPWIAVCALLLVGVLAAVRPVHAWWHAPSAGFGESRATSAALLAGVVVSVVGIGRLAIDGFAPNGRLAWSSLLLIAVGMLLVAAPAPPPLAQPRRPWSMMGT